MPKPVTRIFENREEWLAARRNTLGGSDVPGALFGVGNRSGLVIQLEKLGELPELQEGENDRFDMGLAAEPVVSRIAERATGLAAVEPSASGPVIYYPEGGAIPRIHATPDRFLLTERPKRVHASTLPSKAVAVLSLKTWVSSGRDAWGDVPPLYALLQTQHEMLVTGLRQATITVAFGLAEDSSTYQGIEFHEGVGERIANEAPAWWERHITRREQVSAVGQDQDILRQLYPTSKPSSFLVLSGEGWSTAFNRLAKAKKLKSRVESYIDGLEVAFKEVLGETEMAVIDAQRAVSWRSHPRNDPPREARSYTIRPMRVAKTPKPVRDALTKGEPGAVALLEGYTETPAPTNEGESRDDD